mmetsp:Transcript_95339/g.199437  ORF Transcript_95339/g.199437 Transcript_95339/m.199437 type:complete len:567 (-) Transcript_95339:146-1846(-)
MAADVGAGAGAGIGAWQGPRDPPPSGKPSHEVATIDSTTAAKKVWNEWLDERDRAPAEALSEWFKQKTMEGLEAARVYLQDGYQAAKARTEVAVAAKELLDHGDEGTVQALQTKLMATRALESDRAIVDGLQTFARQCKEEAALHGESQVAKHQLSQRSVLYARALEVLGPPPQEVTLTAVENDAAAFLRLGGQMPIFQSLGGIRPGGGAETLQVGRAQGPRPQDDEFEKMLVRLFQLHDLNNDGTLEERELVKLNEKIAMLHFGKDADKEAVREKFSAMFREKISPDGRPANYQAFRQYTMQTLEALDSQRNAQEMILEQFIVEAESARAAFHCKSFQSVTDAEFLPHLSGDRPSDMGPGGASLRSISELPQPAEETVPFQEGGATSSSPATAGPPEAASARRPPASTASEKSGGYPVQFPVKHGMSLAASTQAPGSSLPSALAAELAEVPRQSVGRTRSSMDHGGSHDEVPSSAASLHKATPPTDTAQQEAQRKATGGYATGDRVQVYSNSKKEWLNAVVLEAFETRREADGYSVPVGTLKVSSMAGIKWIRQDQVVSTVRKRS